MRQVRVLESFEDIATAFARVRQAGTGDEAIEEYAKLHASESGRLSLSGSKKFVLGDSLREQGNEFIEWCVQRVVSNYKAEK